MLVSHRSGHRHINADTNASAHTASYGHAASYRHTATHCNPTAGADEHNCPHSANGDPYKDRDRHTHGDAHANQDSNPAIHRHAYADRADRNINDSRNASASIVVDFSWVTGSSDRRKFYVFTYPHQR